MTTANKLTIMRIALIPVFLVVLYLDFAGARWWADARLVPRHRVAA